MRIVPTQTRFALHAVISGVGCDEGPLYLRKASTIRSLRWSRNHILRAVGAVQTLCRLGVGKRLFGQPSDRQDRQRRELRTRQLPFRHTGRKHGKSCLLKITAASFLLTGCVSSPPILSTPTACSTLLPTEWREGVQGADLPQGSTVGDWIVFADAQTGQLDKANERYNAAVGIIERCEQRDRDAVRKSKRRFF